MLSKLTFAATLLSATAFAEQELESVLVDETRELQIKSSSIRDAPTRSSSEPAGSDREEDPYEEKDPDTFKPVKDEDEGEEKDEEKFMPWPWPGYRMSYCKMRWNPAHTTTYPYGMFYLKEHGPWAPLRIRGWMRRMPTSSPRHGFSIKKNRFDYRDCKSTEPTWDPYNQPYGQMNTWPSQVGDLDPVVHDTLGNAYYYETAWQPTLYGWQTINRRSMTIYEEFADHENWYGRPVACCNIRAFWIIKYPW